MKKAGGFAVNVQKKVRISETPVQPASSGTNLSQLNNDDKLKVSKLVEKVLELGRENAELRAELEASWRRREDDVAIAIGIVRAELQKKNEEVDDLRSKRGGALELLHRYQQKISELVDNVRSLQRRDVESKSQIVGYKTELNNLQQLLETQSQTIQSYRLQITSASTTDSGRIQLEEALRKRSVELNAAQARVVDLETNMQQLYEQQTNIRSVVYEKDKQIVELHAMLLKQNSDAFIRQDAAHPPPALSNSRSIPAIDVERMMEKADLSDLLPQSISALNDYSAQPSHIQPTESPLSWGVNLKDEDFISHLERLAKDKKLLKERNANVVELIDSVPFSHVQPPEPPPPRILASLDNRSDDIIGGKTGYANEYSTLKFENSSVEASIEPLSRAKRSQSPVNITRRKDELRVKSVRKAKQSASLSSSANTFLKSLPKADMARGDHSTSGSTMIRRKDIDLKQIEKKVKFGVKIDHLRSNPSAVYDSNGISTGTQRGKVNFHRESSKAVRTNSSPMSPGYDPVLFDLLEEMDTHDNSTISSISRNHEGNRW